MPDLIVDAVPQRADVFVSVVSVVDATMDGIVSLLTDLHDEVSNRYANFEILIVDNGMKPTELARVRAALSRLNCIRVLRLSRRFTVDNATFAGLESAIGDYVVVMELARDPISSVPQIVQLIQSGSDIVQGISSVRMPGSWLSRTGRRIFYWYNRKYLNVDIPPPRNRSVRFHETSS